MITIPKGEWKWKGYLCCKQKQSKICDKTIQWILHFNWIYFHHFDCPNNPIACCVGTSYVTVPWLQPSWNIISKQASHNLKQECRVVLCANVKAMESKWISWNKQQQQFLRKFCKWATLQLNFQLRQHLNIGKTNIARAGTLKAVNEMLGPHTVEVAQLSFSDNTNNQTNWWHL